MTGELPPRFRARRAAFRAVSDGLTASPLPTMALDETAVYMILTLIATVIIYGCGFMSELQHELDEGWKIALKRRAREEGVDAEKLKLVDDEADELVKLIVEARGGAGDAAFAEQTRKELEGISYEPVRLTKHERKVKHRAHMAAMRLANKAEKARKLKVKQKMLRAKKKIKAGEIDNLVLSGLQYEEGGSAQSSARSPLPSARADGPIGVRHQTKREKALEQQGGGIPPEGGIPSGLEGKDLAEYLSLRIENLKQDVAERDAHLKELRGKVNEERQSASFREIGLIPVGPEGSPLSASTVDLGGSLVDSFQPGTAALGVDEAGTRPTPPGAAAPAGQRSPRNATEPE